MSMESVTGRGATMPAHAGSGQLRFASETRAIPGRSALMRSAIPAGMAARGMPGFAVEGRPNGPFGKAIL